MATISLNKMLHLKVKQKLRLKTKQKSTLTLVPATRHNRYNSQKPLLLTSWRKEEMLRGKGQRKEQTELGH